METSHQPPTPQFSNTHIKMRCGLGRNFIGAKGSAWRTRGCYPQRVVTFKELWFFLPNVEAGPAQTKGKKSWITFHAARCSQGPLPEAS
jgi:hypothetical protein